MLTTVLTMMLFSAASSASRAVAQDSASSAPISAAHAQEMEEGLKIFRSHVRTILVGRCLKCHGGESVEGGFDLSTREGILLGGDAGVSVDVSSPATSRLVRLIRHAEEPIMPEDGAKLDDDQIAVIEQWIALGAPYDRPLVDGSDADPLGWTKKVISSDARDFWAFRPLINSQPPQVATSNHGGNEVDQFVIARQLTEGLQMNPQADRKTLLRRAFLDLTGLVPTPQQVEDFIADEASDAWEKQLDQLLDSDHYGERWARHWLDLARFAESFGFEQDYDRPHAYHYRDFVIRALNDDLPYDQFVQWQIAGDELEPNNPQALMATGFLGAGVFPTQLTEKEFESARYDELDDMVSTLGTTFLGFTIGCARCHDHKFDPIPSRDYYQLISVFGNTIRSNVEIPIVDASFQDRLNAWQTEERRLQFELSRFESEELPARLKDYIERLRIETDGPSESVTVSGWELPDAATWTSEQGAAFEPKDDGSFLVTGINANQDKYVATIETLATELSGLRIDALPDASLPQGGPGRAGNGNFGLSRIRVLVEPLDRSSPAQEVQLLEPQVTFQQNESNLSILSTLDDQDQTGWAVDPQFNRLQSASYRFASPVKFHSGVRLVVTLVFRVNTQHNIGRPRIAIASQAALPRLESEVQSAFASHLRSLMATEPVALNAEQENRMRDLYKTHDSRWQDLNRALIAHRASRPLPETVTAMISSEGVKPIPNHGDDRGYPHFYKETYFLKRGDVQQKQAVAPPGFMQALSRLDDPSSEVNWSKWLNESNEKALPRTLNHNTSDSSSKTYRRSALAKWMTDTHHGAGQQLARVIVNRIWQYHFGRGLVATANDFGFQGERPTHPELLDWLAQRLIDEGWRIKPIHRLIMSSTVYRQSSQFHEEASRIDPANQWLWRFAPRRMEAETIRDSILEVTGELDKTMYGPGTLDLSMKRRSLYFFIKRSQLVPFMQVFDSPEPLVGIGQRPSTTIAPQALMLMNNNQVRQWAIAFSQRILAEENTSTSNVDTVDRQVEQAYQRALLRLPSAIEADKAKDFLLRQRESYQTDRPDRAVELALADFCHILFSLNEFVYID